MRKYSNIHGAPAVSCYFTRTLKHSVNESIVKSIRKLFKLEESKRRGRGEVESVCAIFAIINFHHIRPVTFVTLVSKATLISFLVSHNLP